MGFWTGREHDNHKENNGKSSCSWRCGVHNRSGGVIPAKVLEICDDCLETDKDILFYDEHATVWMLTESEAKKITPKSQKSVLY